MVHTNDIWVLLIPCGVLCDSILLTDEPDRQLSSLREPVAHPTALSRSKKAHNSCEFVHGPDAWATNPRAITRRLFPPGFVPSFISTQKELRIDMT
jgi:hypothetical protein